MSYEMKFGQQIIAIADVGHKIGEDSAGVQHRWLIVFFEIILPMVI